MAGRRRCRLPEPMKLLHRLPGLVKPGGQLFITTPFTWLEEYTERQEWLGGFKDASGENFTTLDGLKELLGVHFDLLGEPVDVPFVIRETRRKFQHTLSQMTVWKLVR